MFKKTKLGPWLDEMKSVIGARNEIIKSLIEERILLPVSISFGAKTAFRGFVSGSPMRFQDELRKSGLDCWYYDRSKFFQRGNMSDLEFNPYLHTLTQFWWSGHPKQRSMMYFELSGDDSEIVLSVLSEILKGCLFDRHLLHDDEIICVW